MCICVCSHKNAIHFHVSLLNMLLYLSTNCCVFAFFCVCLFHNYLLLSVIIADCTILRRGRRCVVRSYVDVYKRVSFDERVLCVYIWIVYIYNISVQLCCICIRYLSYRIIANRSICTFYTSCVMAFCCAYSHRVCRAMCAPFLAIRGKKRGKTKKEN